MRVRLGLVVMAMVTAGCGYHVSGHADTMPKDVHTIAIPAWGNITSRYKLTEHIPGALGREFLSRTRYRVTSNPEEADAVLTGSVVNYLAFPSVSDPLTGRATAIQISVYLQVTLTDKRSGKVIYTRPNIEFKQRYEIAVDQKTYFDESDVALQRLSRDVARTLVSAVLEAF
ncbi:MAG: LPS assembly lipoprotein LptE [Bryobacteraceae bacterium]|nr:LPS assembly lipoprotein LptE [Bryobacteraceae bacterium]